MEKIIEALLKEQFNFTEAEGDLISTENLKLSDLYRVMKMLSDTTVEVCANVAQVEEDFGEDFENQGYDERKMTHQGGWIRDEHFVQVDKESILKVKQIIA